MNKRITQIVCFIMLLCMAGCGSPSADAPDGDALMTVKATVTKTYGKSMEIRTEQGWVMSMPASWLEGKAEPKEGLLLEITASNEILETYPSQFSKIESVKVIGYEESGRISALDENGTLSKEGYLGGFRYQIGTYEQYDSKFKDWGYYLYENDARAPWVLELCSGEHSTGGYGISIVNIEADEAGNLCITVEETAPDPGAVVTAAFTFPKVTLLIYEETKMPSSVTVKTTSGTELPFLGNMPPKSETDEEDTAGQRGEAWEKVVIAPPEGAYCNISLCLPDGWGWSSSWTEDIPVSCLGIAIYPKTEGDANGCISIQYSQGFGVCGTGLESVETTFNGHAAHKGTFDGHPYWDYIALSDEYRDCVIINNAGETWFDKYREELEEILATVEFALSDGTPLKDISREDIGEIYAKDAVKSDIAMTADGIKYVRNQLLVSAKMDCTKEKIENLGSAYGFEIVGYIELTQDYQIEFTCDMEEAELLKMIKVLEEEDCISMCSLNSVVEVSYD